MIDISASQINEDTSEDAEGKAANNRYKEALILEDKNPNAPESDITEMINVNINPLLGGDSTRDPFRAYRTGSDTVKVEAGSVESIAYTPANIKITGTGTNLYLQVTVSAAGAVTAVTVTSAASLPADTATEAYLLLATITATTDSGPPLVTTITGITNYLSGSLGHAYGGGTTHILWRV